MKKIIRGFVSLALLLVLSFAPGQILASSRVDTQATSSYQVFIPLDYFDSLQVVSHSSATLVTFSAQSNTSISVAFMTSSQFNAFNESAASISNSLYIQNGTSVRHSIRIGQGLYYLVFYAYLAAANVSYAYDVYPNDPLKFGELSPPQPTGIASFGLYNDSGNLVSYDIKTSEVVGVANVYSILAYNGTAAKTSTNLSGASLQLNSMLVVDEKSGSQRVYWCQNVPDFVTNASVVSHVDNVWNFTDDRFLLSNESITSHGGGFVSSFNDSGDIEHYYSYGTSNFTYAAPFRFVLLMNESLVANQGVLIQMGSKVLGNGSAGASPIQWFDNITIHDQMARAAYFLTSGNDSTPTGHFFDTEFVFGGEGNGASTSFRVINASLDLFYYNESSRSLVSFPSYYNFGGDTQEGAYNLDTTYSGRGLVGVSVGAPRYIYLGNASGTFSLSGGVSGVPEFNTPALIVTFGVALSTAAILSARFHRRNPSTDSSDEGDERPTSV